MRFPERLLQGYQSFRDGRLPIEQHQYAELAEVGQSPEIMVIGCCDSRVSPEVIFDARPGELFVVRNVANLVPPYSPSASQHGVSSAIEFAVEALKVKHIVVLGHARCGGIRAFADDEVGPLSPGDFIGKWMSLIAPAADELGPRGAEPLEDYLQRLEQVSAVKTLENLMTFPFVQRRVEGRSLELHAAYFAVATGLLMVRRPDSDVFEPISTAKPGN
ncbi:carbonic anhydrase [Afifella marina]|uniref:Carbonic anhydrase n=1 Tax=Afifella marina DSM 2698 TaxID=1120955 RepID=A0A1G5N607_AFIMA|nr:carbonic anhydrase [Afifella marina]MBK1622549.1 carbonic anhydrase [Afifella marina DSM 2698]MBK1626736.1 carbonic anhydrase [Afifella marina]MBK5919334.1 carbonate dehydratase [Afifella marina]RAI21366.1 carbonate dehydratase [Afifella marina DSM 2698]SCZ32875.1 carbonic anhydrase [Afifella marina DSM 2698]